MSKSVCVRCGNALQKSVAAGLCPHCLLVRALKPDKKDISPLSRRKISKSPGGTQYPPNSPPPPPQPPEHPL